MEGRQSKFGKSIECGGSCSVQEAFQLGGFFLFVCLSLRQSLAMSPRLEHSGAISAHCNLCLQHSSEHLRHRGSLFACLFVCLFLKRSLTLFPRPECNGESHSISQARVQWGVSLYFPGQSAMVRSRLTASFAPWVHVILLPQPPEELGLLARAG